jgi:hypothetical protein
MTMTSSSAATAVKREIQTSRPGRRSRRALDKKEVIIFLAAKEHKERKKRTEEQAIFTCSVNSAVLPSANPFRDLCERDVCKEQQEWAELLVDF